jgi:hypothetical protein
MYEYLYVLLLWKQYQAEIAAMAIEWEIVE